MSYLWWILEPVLEMAVLYLVFATFLGAAKENFVAFLLIGIVPFSWFSRSITNSQGSIVGAKSLMSQIKIEAYFFPMLEIGQDLVKQGITFTMLLIFLLVYGIEFQWIWLLFPLLVILQFFLVASCGILVAAVIPFFHDLKYLVGTGLQVMFFGSGIFFDSQDLPEDLQFFFFLNPLACLIKSYRDILLYNTWPDMSLMFVVATWALAALLLALIIYRNYDRSFARMIEE